MARKVPRKGPTPQNKNGTISPVAHHEVALPAHGTTAVVCFGGAPSETTLSDALEMLFPSTWNRGTNPGVRGVGQTTLDGGRRVLLIDFDGGASDADRQREVAAASAVPGVTGVVEVEKSPQEGGAQTDPCP